MLETIANPAATATSPTGVVKQEPTPSFLITPRSMMPSWCESPRVLGTPDNKNLSIEIPKLDEPRNARSEQRDAAEDTGNETPREGSDERNGADTPSNGSHVLSSKYECDYDKSPTQIFLSLQKKEWDAAAKRADENALEARMWVSRREKHGNLRWRLLPLHAAIIFKAPEKVVETLLAAYPKGAQSKDDQGMLPLHLAFRHGSTEATVNLLLVAYPQSASVEDRKGRIPLVLAQASASANRDAFVRALERGPTYYANAAAATERAAVTTEQRALFDSKLIEVEKKHQQDVNILKEERNGLTESVELVQRELAKQKGATQVLVDHVNSLEAQLRSKGETERFLAVKAATLDSNLKDLGEAKDQTQYAFEEQLIEMQNENANLMNQLEVAKEEMKEIQSGEQPTREDIKKIADKASKQEKELKSLKMEWASSQARSAVLEAQLKSKIENEHDLASQVSRLAAKLAESAADSGNNSTMYSKRVQVLEAEREKLRATVNDLGKKLLKVSHFMNKMTTTTQEKTKKSAEETKAKQAKLLHDASTKNEQLIRTALAERQHMAELLKKQEKEMSRSAKQHQEILEQLEELKNNAAGEDAEEEDFPFSNSLTEEMQDMMTNVLNGMPQVGSEDSDVVDSVMNHVSVPTPKARGSNAEAMHSSLRASSTDTEEDAQKCLEEALRALEQNRTNTNNEGQQFKSMSEVSDATSLSCNPSDEESTFNKMMMKSP